jgi:hypothetical protein
MSHNRRWTDEIDAVLIQMVGEGKLSDAGMAERLFREHQFEASRNAVIGRRTRLSLNGKLPPIPSRVKGRTAARKNRPDRQHPWRGTVKQAPSLPAAPVNHELQQVQEAAARHGLDLVAARVRLVDLGPLPPAAERCRYPLGDVMAKAEFFCGAMVRDPTCVYCGNHAAVAFNGITRRY